MQLHRLKDIGKVQKMVTMNPVNRCGRLGRVGHVVMDRGQYAFCGDAMQTAWVGNAASA